MITRAELIADRQKCESKAKGCLVGLAAGDAFGDLGRTDDYRKRYGIVTEIYANAKSTDDTEFALLTARTLVDYQGQLTTENLVASWQKYILDQGGVFERGGKPLYGAVANLQRGMRPPLSGRDNVMNDDDGAAMRIAPIGVMCAGDPDRAAKLAEIESEISHYEDGVWAAQAVAAGVAVAMVDGSVDEILQTAQRFIPANSWLGRAMKQAMQLCDEARTIEAAWEKLHTDFWTPVHSVAPEAIPQALAVFRLTQGNFRQGLFWGGNFGRDADTIGAIIGALCGARDGFQIIPPAWVAQVRRPSGVCLKFAAHEDIPALAEQLAKLIN